MSSTEQELSLEQEPPLSPEAGLMEWLEHSVRPLCMTLAADLEQQADRKINGFSGLGLYSEMAQYALKERDARLYGRASADDSNVLSYLHAPYVVIHPTMKQKERRELAQAALKEAVDKTLDAVEKTMPPMPPKKAEPVLQEAVSDRKRSFSHYVDEAVRSQCDAIAKRIAESRQLDSKTEASIHAALQDQVLTYADKAFDAAVSHDKLPNGQELKEYLRAEYCVGADTANEWQVSSDALALMRTAKQMVCHFVPLVGLSRQTMPPTSRKPEASVPQEQPADEKEPGILKGLTLALVPQCDTIAAHIAQSRHLKGDDVDAISKELQDKILHFGLIAFSAARHHGRLPDGHEIKEYVWAQYRADDGAANQPPLFAAAHDATTLIETAKRVVNDYVPLVGHSR